MCTRARALNNVLAKVTREFDEVYVLNLTLRLAYSHLTILTVSVLPDSMVIVFHD